MNTLRYEDMITMGHLMFRIFYNILKATAISGIYSEVTEDDLEVKIEWNKRHFYEYNLSIRNTVGSELTYQYSPGSLHIIYCNGYPISYFGLEDLIGEINDVLDCDDITDDLFESIQFEELIHEWLFQLHEYVSNRNIIEDSIPIETEVVRSGTKWSVSNDDVTIESDGSNTDVLINNLKRGSFIGNVDVEFTKKLLGNYVYILNYKPSYTKAAI